MIGVLGDVEAVGGGADGAVDLAGRIVQTRHEVLGGAGDPHPAIIELDVGLGGPLVHPGRDCERGEGQDGEHGGQPTARHTETAAIAGAPRECDAHGPHRPSGTGVRAAIS